MDQFKTRNSAHLQSCNVEEAKRRHETFAVELRKQSRTDRFLLKKARLTKNKAGEDFEQLFALLTDSHPEIAIATLTPLERNQRLIAAFKSCCDPIQQRRLLIVLRKVTSMKEPQLLLYAQAAVVRKLVVMMGAEEVEVAKEASWVIVNLASVMEDSVMQVLSSAGVPKKLIELLTHPSQEVVENCVWGLGNYAGGEPHRRDEVLALGVLTAVEPLVRTLDSRTPEFASTFCWLLQNLSRNHPSASYLPLFCPLLPPLLRTSHDSGLEQTLQCVFNLTEKDQEWLDGVCDAGVVPAVCAMMAHRSQDVQFWALKIMGNVCSGTDQQTELALNCEVLDKLLALLESSTKVMKKEVLWIVSNVLASQPQQVETAIKHQVFGAVLRALRDGDLGVRKEAIFCIANLACSRTPLCIPALCDSLDSLLDCLSLPDPRLQKAVLDALSHFLDLIHSHSSRIRLSDIAIRLEAAGAVEKLEALLTHGNALIRQQTAIVLKKMGDEEAQNTLDETRAELGFAYNYQFS